MTTEAKIRPLYSAETIAERVQRLGDRVRKDLLPEDPLIISLLSGSALFLADLVRAIPESVRFEFVRVEYSESGSEDILQIHYPITLRPKGQTLLLLKDVVTSGITESYLRTQFQAMGARKVAFAALIDLPNERKTSFSTDYSLFTAQRPFRLVGYGLRHHGHHGNLPYIGRLIEEGDE